MLHRLCAYPVLISWAIGACFLNTISLVLLSNEVSLSAIISDWETILLLGTAFVPTTLLGYFLGMFTVWPLVRILCSKCNGAPLKVGDQVMILSGRQKRQIADVYKIAKGQGGWNLAWLDLGQEHGAGGSDIFEEYSLLKLVPKQIPEYTVFK